MLLMLWQSLNILSSSNTIRQKIVEKLLELRFLTFLIIKFDFQLRKDTAKNEYILLQEVTLDLDEPNQNLKVAERSSNAMDRVHNFQLFEFLSCRTC